MHKRLARIALVLVGGCAFAGCNVGGVADFPSVDAGPGKPDLGPDVARDVTGIVVNLPDAPIASETGGTSCVAIDPIAVLKFMLQFFTNKHKISLV